MLENSKDVKSYEIHNPRYYTDESSRLVMGVLNLTNHREFGFKPNQLQKVNKISVNVDVKTCL